MKKASISGVSCCLILAALLISGCFGGTVEGVRVAEVARGEASRAISAIGTLEAGQPVDVVPLVGGTIVALPVKEGDYVAAGDVLCTLDEKELAAQAAQAQANYLTSASIGDLLEGSYSNMSLLYESMGYAAQVFGEIQGQIDDMVLSFYDIVPAFISYLPPDKQQYLQALLAEQRTKYVELVNSRPAPPDVSYAGYPSSAAAADAARTEAARYEYERVAQGAKSPNILAPVSGYVVFAAQPSLNLQDMLSEMLGGLGSLSSSLGSLSSFLGGDLSGLLGGGTAAGELKVGSKLASGQPAFQIVDLQDMKVKAQVEEADIPLVAKDQSVSIYLDAYPDLTFTGKVIQVGVKAETGSAGTTVFPVVIQMDRTEIPLRLGYNATVDIEVLSKKSAITVPVTALIEEEGKVFVYVVVEGKAQHREIAMGDRTDEWAEVLSGLEEGERIVTEGASKVKEGQKLE